MLWSASADPTGLRVREAAASAVREVYKYSKGGPRLINAVCDNALLAGFVARTKTIDGRCVKKAIRQLEG